MGGNAIRFLKEYENLSFIDAVKKLAAMQGLLVPNINDDFNKKNPPTSSNPNATADAYMRDVRGFDLADIKGWYRQGKWWHSGSQKGTETVRFDISRADDVYMERFCEPIPITSNGITKIRKQNFNGSYKGLWWQPPSLEINEGDTFYIAEAIIDAISFNVNGFKTAPAIRTWGFLCPNKVWIHWSEFTDASGNQIGKGCE